MLLFFSCEYNAPNVALGKQKKGNIAANYSLCVAVVLRSTLRMCCHSVRTVT